MTGQGSATAPLQRFFWLHPEWWTAALSCGAAAAMVLHAVGGSGHAHLQVPAFGQQLGSWMLMVVAMMLPLVLDIVRAVAQRSLWARRHRAMAVFLAGFSVPWFLLGALVAALAPFWSAHADACTAGCFALAALWFLSPTHRRAMVAAHRLHPLAPTGWRAHRDCLRHGWAVGRQCAISCWPLMLACACAGHQLLALAGGLAASLLERQAFRPRSQLAAVLSLSLSASYLLAAGWR